MAASLTNEARRHWCSIAAMREPVMLREAAGAIAGACARLAGKMHSRPAKRRLTLPASLVPAQPGDHFQAEFDADEDAVVFRRIARNADWLKVLKACPVKMDDLPSRRREFPKRLKL